MLFFDNALVQHDVIRPSRKPAFDDDVVAWLQLRLSRNMETVQVTIERHLRGHPAGKTDYEMAGPGLIQAFYDAGQGNGLIKKKTVRPALGNIERVGKARSSEGEIRDYLDPAFGTGVIIKTVDAQTRYDDR